MYLVYNINKTENGAQVFPSFLVEDLLKNTDKKIKRTVKKTGVEIQTKTMHLFVQPYEYKPGVQVFDHEDV